MELIVVVFIDFSVAPFSTKITTAKITAFFLQKPDYKSDPCCRAHAKLCLCTCVNCTSKGSSRTIPFTKSLKLSSMTIHVIRFGRLCLNALQLRSKCQFSYFISGASIYRCISTLKWNLILVLLWHPGEILLVPLHFYSSRLWAIFTLTETR